MNQSFLRDRERAALNLSNRGPLSVDEKGKVDPSVVEAYWSHGFYVLTDVLSLVEMAELSEEFQNLLQRAPQEPGGTRDSSAKEVGFDERQRKLFHFVKPLTDPYGGTDVTHSRYPVKMPEPELPLDSPDEVLLQIGGILQFLDSALRVYGHPKLLALTEAINGHDFTPFTEVIWLKQPRFGAAVSWHQDGTTHWDSPNLDAGTHGFNFMVNIHETTTENSLWVVPGTHKNGKADLNAMLADSDSDRPAGAVPLLCKPGDVAICNRQIVHGSFPNTSDVPRYTFVFGFHRRASVEGIRGWGREPYSKEFIERSCRLIDVAIDARRQRFPNESSYCYRPSIERTQLRWTTEERRAELQNYQLRALGI
ncbi:MAG: phytanoyl-CoA dioxygenase family protein [Gammaproteobacteria bacterium]|nr:phytanoyl-CoA dioxygenase family protein [Gammaproteobacteria bacterium]